MRKVRMNGKKIAVALVLLTALVASMLTPAVLASEESESILSEPFAAPVTEETGPQSEEESEPQGEPAKQAQEQPDGQAEEEPAEQPVEQPDGEPAGESNGESLETSQEEPAEESGEASGESVLDSEASLEPMEEIEASPMETVILPSDSELRVTIHRPHVTGGESFTVSLENGQSVTLTAGQGESVSSAFLQGVTPGTHTLTIAADGYLTYVQTLTFQAEQCLSLDIYNDAAVNDGRGDGELFGVMPLGDVNADGVINDADAELVTDAMDSADPACDLDSDGTVTLSDLALTVRNQSGVQAAQPLYTVSTAVLETAVEVSVSQNTGISGQVENLLDQLSDGSAVGLSSGSGAISGATPAEVTIETKAGVADKAAMEAEALVIAAPAGSENYMTAGEVEVIYVDDSGAEHAIVAQLGNVPVTAEAEQAQTVAAEANETVVTEDGELISALALESVSAAAVYAGPVSTESGTASAENDGTVIIDLGKRVAIKRVTIRVTATANQNNLAEIAAVEFLGNFGDRIPEPQLSIPTITAVSNTETDGLGYKNLTVTWNPEPNVTGYEISVSGPGYNKTAACEDTSYTFMGDSFNGTVKSFMTYTVKVRSVNGDWRSSWSEEYTHTVTCNKVPPKPEYVSAAPGVQSLRVSWRCKYDAEWFTLYYKAETDDDFTAIENLTAPGYTLQNLTGGVNYTVYVVAHNRNGSSGASSQAVAMPTTATGVEMPKYKLINVNDASGAATTHIASVSGARDYTIYRADGTTVNQSAATAEDWKALIDNDPASYLFIPDWDSGVSYANFRGPIIQLDDTYTFDTIRIAPFEGSSVSLYDADLGYKDENGKIVRVDAALSAKMDSQNRRYYEIIASEPITSDYVEVYTRTFNTRNYTISEVKVYEYDDLEAQVAALFSDNMRTTLRAEVTEQDIEALVERANTVDPVSGEYHPHRSTILAELEYAMQYLREGAAAEILRVDNQITTIGGPANGFAQALSDYQPLGYVAAAGDTVVIYVSDVTASGAAARGKDVSLKLIATQYHPEVAAWQSSAIQLKAGRNEITIPRVGSYAKEAGGSLYLQYTAARGAKDYDIRVSGATKIPVLHLDGVTGDARTAAIAAYIQELESYVSGLSALHETAHAGSENGYVNAYGYSATDCFLNATEITLENMMYSVPATQVWSAIQSAPASRLATSIAAMEQEIDLFYQFKGLNKNATDNDAYPFTRLNIRYHQMFTGAFMYAGGKHIGIEFGSVGGLFTTSPIVTDANGKYVSGNLSGWGIAHEIGHCINAAAYQRVEVTNNVFAQLAKVGEHSETSANFRTSYENVYKAVATGRTGHTGNLAVQLAQYWQLHLAYDNNYAYKVYDSIEAQQAGLFYARLESYLRTPSKAPVDLSGSGDQLFMRAACAAAEKDLLDFFRAWGFAPDAGTVAYAANFEKETRKIQYIDDDSRLYRMEGGAGMSAGTAVNAEITNAVGSRINGKTVTISLSNTNTNSGAMLGYEICRNGKVVAFVTADKTSYTDVVTTENNKAFVYTVTGIDRLLGQTETVSLGEIKLCHDGAIDNARWTASTNMTSVRDTVVEKHEDDPDAGHGTAAGSDTVSAITAALDNDPNTVYYGTATGSRPYILLSLGGTEQVTALKFTPAAADYSGNASEGTNVSASELYKYRLFGYKVEVSTDGETWTTVKEGSAYTGSAANPDSWVKQSDVIENADGSYTLYFNKMQPDGTMDPFMYTYDAAYIKLTAVNMSSMAVAELDILGPTSDNVELDAQSFGILAADYHYGDDGVIPAGSAVFYGEYRGDPSYNVVLLRDQNGDVLDGQQVFFAEVPESGALGQTSDGRWIFWLENRQKTDDLGDSYNEYDQLSGLETVQVQLYRVQDALTLAGQRITSTSLTMAIPASLPSVTITDAAAVAAYAPESAMVEAANAWAAAEETVTGESSPAEGSEGAYYADTGAVETLTEDEESIASPVQMTADKSAGAVSVEIDPDEIAIAMAASLTVSGGENASVQMEENSGLYQTYRCSGGVLTVYAVARSGNIGDHSVKLTVSDLSEDAEMSTGDTLAQVEGQYTSIDREVPAGIVTLGNENTGDDGGNGNTGNTGDSGNTGNTGDNGNAGNTGSTGDNGSAGDSGNTGSTGNTGTGNSSVPYAPKTGDDANIALWAALMMFMFLLSLGLTVAMKRRSSK